MPPGIRAIIACVLGVALLLPLSACATRGGTIIAIRGSTPAEQEAIREHFPRIEAAVDQVVAAYGIGHLTVRVVVKPLGGLGETSPDVGYTARVFGGSVSLNKRLLLDPPDNIDEVLLGLFAHELAHAMHYEAMNTVDLAIFGQRYAAFYHSPNGRYQQWARAYERLTDLTAIAHGFAGPLAAQKRASTHNIEKYRPAKVWDFYLSGDEIALASMDPADLSQRISERLEEVKLPSLRRWAQRRLLPLLEQPEAVSLTALE